MPARSSFGDAKAVRQVREEDRARVPAVDAQNVEHQLVASNRQLGKDLARIAAEQMDAARELPLEEIEAFDRVGVRHDVDAIVFELRAGRQSKQRAVAGVDADFEQALLEPHGAPDVAASRGEIFGGRTLGVPVLALAIENVSLQRLAGLLDDLVDPPQPSAKDCREDFVEGVAADRVVGNFRLRDRLARNESAAVHGGDAPSDRTPTAATTASEPPYRDRFEVGARPGSLARGAVAPSNRGGPPRPNRP